MQCEGGKAHREPELNETKWEQFSQTWHFQQMSTCTIPDVHQQLWWKLFTGEKNPDTALKD